MTVRLKATSQPWPTFFPSTNRTVLESMVIFIVCPPDNKLSSLNRTEVIVPETVRGVFSPFTCKVRILPGSTWAKMETRKPLLKSAKTAFLPSRISSVSGWMVIGRVLPSSTTTKRRESVRFTALIIPLRSCA
ncbi:MAG: hypothetical protein DDT42_00992 [candidate division WS2 bacterium]|uniref:Uncharacterized protein n=1 Tax=Psychracetigena formicireducens TaxID=2986056 RepID=A0A9E2F1X8_PSYF1|nr:hypothetical protein [Candidatus Psychracetigena formicireducens]